MIELTEEQRQELDRPGMVCARDPRTEARYALVRAEVYERLKGLLGDHGEWVDDGYRAAMEVFARDGWDDPRMDVYNSLDPRRPV
jgi:hypothetical protein